MSKIGRISGRNWDEAPLGATHARVGGQVVKWYRKDEAGVWYFYCPTLKDWESSISNKSPDFKLVSKEEDLHPTIDFRDVEVGMFITSTSDCPIKYVILKVDKSVTRVKLVVCRVGLVYNKHAPSPFSFDICCVSYKYYKYSYSFNGEYHQLSHEKTDKELELDELRAQLQEVQSKITQLEAEYEPK